MRLLTGLYSSLRSGDVFDTGYHVLRFMYHVVSGEHCPMCATHIHNL